MTTSTPPKISQDTVSGFGALTGQQFMSLTTFRKDGRGVPTAVWFAEINNVLYFQTQPTTGKVKRLRNSSRVTVAPCTRSGEVLGPVADATARELKTPAEIAIAETALANKYKMMRVMFNGMLRITGALRRRPPIERVYFAISAV
jgi:hypothetical protein